MSEKTQYFNFPIQMLQGVLNGDDNDKQSFLDNLLYYHLFSHSLKLFETTEFDQTKLELFESSARYWNVILGNTKGAQKSGEQLFEQYSNAKVFTGINKDVFWDFQSNYKTNFDWQCLIAFLALKSIVGHKRYCKSNNSLLYARMSGNESSKEGHCMAFTRFQRDKIILKLETKWNLKYYSRYTKGFYFGIDVTLKELIFNAENRRESYKVAELQNAKASILKSYQNSKK